MAKQVFEGFNRRERLRSVRVGPGVFKYLGTACDNETEPTPQVRTRDEFALDNDGNFLIGPDNRPIVSKIGTPVLDKKGKFVMGGPPKGTKIPLETYVIWEKEFPKDKEVVVADPNLARKLRCMPFFEEIGEYEDPRDTENKALKAELKALREAAAEKGTPKAPSKKAS